MIRTLPLFAGLRPYVMHMLKALAGRPTTYCRPSVVRMRNVSAEYSDDESTEPSTSSGWSAGRESFTRSARRVKPNSLRASARKLPAIGSGTQRKWPDEITS